MPTKESPRRLPELWTTGQAATQLGISVSRLAELADLGQIACIRAHTGRLFRPRDVNALAARRRKLAESDWRVKVPPSDELAAGTTEPGGEPGSDHLF